jgi:hypothetical protein
MVSNFILAAIISLTDGADVCNPMYAITVTTSTVILLSILNRLIGLRVDKEHEIEGLDAAEHKDISYVYHHDMLTKVEETNII